MHRSLFAGLVLVLSSGCSLLVTIDEDKYMGGDDSPSGGAHSNSGGSGGAPMETGGAGGSPTGGTGGSETGGAPSGGGHTGGGDTGGAGTGGEPVELPDPLHYYPLDGNGTDQGSATDPLNASVTDTGGWRPTSGVAGGAYQVPSGSNHYLSLEPSVAATNPFTISWWFSQSADSFLSLVSKTHNSGGSPGWEVILDSSGPRIRVDRNGAEEIFVTATIPPASAGLWTHMALSIHEDVSGFQDHILMWVNGESVLDLQTTFPNQAISNAYPVRFGFQEGGSAATPFSGYVDEIRVYDEILSDEQVGALYEMDKP